MKRNLIILVIIGAILIIYTLSGALGHGSSDGRHGGDTLTTESELLTIIDFGDYITVDIYDPWRTSDLPSQLFVLIPEGEDPDSLPIGTEIRTPVSNSMVFSSVYAGAIDELGAVEAIKGVCDASYFKIPAIAARLRDGSVIDAGNSMSPSIEAITMLGPDVILRSAFQNATSGALESSGVPVIECVDYMEKTPLGRAEWIKLLGLLYGRRDRADSIYNNVVASYNAVKQMADTVAHRPKVISETVTDGVWYVPGGGSYMARLFADAGGDYPWTDDNSAGSLPLDFAAVYDRAADADIWLVKTYGKDLTLPDLKSIYPLNDRFKAFSSGSVYACNTEATMLFEDFPFHPEKLLREYYTIFHPRSGGKTHYFKRVDR